MRKQIIAVLAILVLAAAAFVVSVAVRADASTGGGGDCEPTQGHYTEWVDSGDPIKIEPDEAEPPTDREFERWVFLGTEEEVLDPGSPGTEDHWENLGWYIWTGGPRDEAPALDDPGWHGPQPNVPNGAPHDATPGTVYSTSDGNGRGSWFKYDGDFIEGTDPVPPTTQTLRIYQPQVREWVDGNECPPEECPEGTTGTPPDCVEQPTCEDDPTLCPPEPPCPGDKEPAQMCNPPEDPEPPVNPPRNPEKPEAPRSPVKKAAPEEPVTPAVPSAVDAGI